MSTETRCPHCGRTNDAHSNADNATPEPGDVSICWGCGAIAIFTEDGVRSPTAEERADIEADPGVRAVQAAARESYTPSQAIDLVRSTR